MSPPPSPDSVFAEWERLREAGEGVDPETVIARHPEIAQELRDRFDAVRLLDVALRHDAAGSPPARIGAHRILREIGRGGMGVVYEAEQEGMERRVALKVLFPSLAPPRGAVERFRQEAQIAGRLKHTNIVSVHALGQDAGVWWCAMELVDGPPLSRVIDGMRQHRRPGPRGVATPPPSTLTGETPGTSAHARGVAHRFAAIADALEVAHGAGVLHRDVKPSNLLLDSDGHLRLVDFGLARLDGDANRLTRTGDLLGTPLYMSPERFRGAPATIASDLYSLGATLYETLALRPPHAAKDPARLASLVLTREPAPLRVLDASVPKDLETIVAKALEKDPARRYATAGAMAEDLRAFAQGEAIRAKRASLWRRMWRPVRRHPARAAAIAIALLGAGTAAVLAGRVSSEEQARHDSEYRLLLERAAAVRPHDADEDASRARTLYDQAVALQPDRSEAYVGRAVSPGASLEARLRDAEAARARGTPAGTAALLRALAYLVKGKDAEAEAAWAEAGAAATADDPLAHLVAGGRAASRNDRTAAEREFSAALAGAPPTSPLRWPALLALLDLHVRLEQHAKALDTVHALQAAGDDRVKTAALEAWLWRRLGKEAEATTRADAVIARVAGTEDAAVNAGNAWRSYLAWDWVERLTDRALAAFPGSADLLGLRAGAYDATYRYDAALATWERAHAAAPTVGWIRARMAATLGNAGKMEQALAASKEAIDLAPADAEVWRIRGDLLRGAGQREAGEEAVRRALQLDPGERGALVLLAAFRFWAEDSEQAEAILRPHLERHPADPMAGLVLATGRLDQGRFAEALQATEAPLAATPESADLLEVRGRALYKLKRTAEGEKALRQALAIRPKSPRGNAWLGMLLVNQRRWAEAEEPLRRATQYGWSGVPDVWNQLGSALKGQDKLEQALEAYREAARLDPEQTAFLGNVGGTLLDLGKIDEAIRVLEDVVRRRPEDAIDRYNLGQAYLKAARDEDALRELGEVARLDPTDPVCVAERATILARSGRLPQAIEEYRRAIGRAPRDAMIRHDFAATLLNSGKRAEAEEQAAQAVEFAPRDAGSQLLLGHLMLLRDAAEDALPHLEAARRLDPTRPDCHLEYASGCFEAGREGAAVDALADAVKRFESHAELRFALGLALADAGDAKVRNATLAAIHARRAVDLDSAQARYHVALGAALYRQARYGEAIAELRKAEEGKGPPLEPVRSQYLAMALAREGRKDDALAAQAAAEAARHRKDGDGPAHARRAKEVEETLREAVGPANPAGR